MCSDQNEKMSSSSITYKVIQHQYSFNVQQQDEYIQTTEHSIINQTSVLHFNATAPGMVECTAVNSQGKGSSKAVLGLVNEEVRQNA